MSKQAVKDAKESTESLSKLSSVRLKRQITIKSVVNDTFRDKAKNEFSEELKLIDSQLEQLENQYLAMLKQLENLARQGQNVQKQLEQLNGEAQEKRTQLAQVKMTVSQNLANLDRVENGGFAVTGVLESYIDVKVGDNIYDKIRGAEIIIEDGTIKEIIG